MAELDAQLRNERLTFETDLDLLKEETALELEVDMEERLAAFRTRKQEEIAVQLERQLDKREEIMRNKALIDVRKREASIRAEIEAQLASSVRKFVTASTVLLRRWIPSVKWLRRRCVMPSRHRFKEKSIVLRLNCKAENKNSQTFNRQIRVLKSDRSGCNPSPVKHQHQCQWVRIRRHSALVLQP